VGWSRERSGIGSACLSRVLASGLELAAAVLLGNDSWVDCIPFVSSKEMLMLEEKPSFVSATSTRLGFTKRPAVQIGGLVMTSEIWCPAPANKVVAEVRAASTVRQGLEIARTLGYGRKSAA